jgi:hypothetical protein
VRRRRLGATGLPVDLPVDCLDGLDRAADAPVAVGLPVHAQTPDGQAAHPAGSPRREGRTRMPHLMTRVVDLLVARVVPKATAKACDHGDYTVVEFCYCSANNSRSYWRYHTYYGGVYCGDESWTTCYVVHNGCFF